MLSSLLALIDSCKDDLTSSLSYASLAITLITLRHVSGLNSAPLASSKPESERALSMIDYSWEGDRDGFGFVLVLVGAAGLNA